MRMGKHLIFPLIMTLFCFGHNARANCGELVSAWELTRPSYQILKNRLELAPRRPSAHFDAYEIFPGAHFIRFKKQKEMAQTFMRFQAYYEDPRFQGEFFPQYEFIEWFRWKRAFKPGRFDYYTRARGFNFPISNLEAFYDGSFKYITQREKSVLSLYQDLRKSGQYVIATFNEGPDEAITDGELNSLRHEIAHAFYHLDPQYRAQVEAILGDANPDLMDRIATYLHKEAGYHPSVMEDELHAYLLNDWDIFIQLQVAEARQIRPLVRMLHEHFEKTIQRIDLLQRL